MGVRWARRRSLLLPVLFSMDLIHCGEQQYPAGRSGEPAAVLLGESLKKLGLRGSRLKTGTPPRLDGRTIDWTQFTGAAGRCRPYSLQFSHAARGASRFAGALLYRIHHAGDASASSARMCIARPMYSGQIQSVGPRYCPSIEDKIVKFPDKTTAPAFSRARRAEYP